jgi:hypothetical protein
VKLLSTLIAENSVELTYADNPELEEAATLLILRLPKESTDDKSLRWNRYWALNQLREMLDELMADDRSKLG